MQVLHTSEYIRLVNEYYEHVPSMDDFNQFEICSELIADIPNDVLNERFIQIVKDRKVNNCFYNKINSEFNQICLSMNLDRKDRNELIDRLKTNKL